MATTNMRIVIRRDTKANWDANSQVVLLQGEQGLEINVDQTGVQRPTRMKVGDGVSQWGQLPYFTGGITAIDHDTIVMDASGKIMLNKDLYLGDLTNTDGDSVSVKDYVDAKVAVEAEARTNGDSALGARIDNLEVTSANGDTALSARLDVLEADPTTQSALNAEISNRQGADSALQQQITALSTSAAESVGANADAINTLDQKVDANKLISDQTDTALGAISDSIAAAMVDSVQALIAADQAEAGFRVQADDSINARIDALETNDHPTVSDIYDSITTGDDSVYAFLSDSVAALEAELAAKADLDSVAGVLRDVDSYVGNYQGGATISDDLVTLADYNAVQDTVVSALIAGNTAFTGSITAPGFNGPLVGNVTGDVTGNADTATLADEASAAEPGGALDTRLDSKLDASAVSAFGLTLVDDADAATARGTLGLGTAATTASTDYATAAQGATADANKLKLDAAAAVAAATGTATGTDATVINNLITVVNNLIAAF